MNEVALIKQSSIASKHKLLERHDNSEYPQAVMRLTFVFVLLGFVSCDTNPIHKAALVDFYHSTNGPHWAVQWNLSSDPCSDGWYGIKCEGSSVFTISIQGNDLEGTIPSSISSIDSLRFFYLSRNNLSGTIPSSIVSLARLEQLGLDENSLSGGIPSNISQLAGLQSLFLQGNGLTGRLDDICGLQQVHYLYLSRNVFTGSIPGCFASMSTLEQLGLDDNNLTGEVRAKQVLKTDHADSGNSGSWDSSSCVSSE
jgi:hypothetical protein